jgi:hypothetical protein
MAQAVSRRPLTTKARGSVPGHVHVRFVVDKVALGQVFLRVVGFPLSISFHWCSIPCKTAHLHHRGCTKSLKAVVRRPFIQKKKSRRITQTMDRSLVLYLKEYLFLYS